MNRRARPFPFAVWTSKKTPWYELFWIYLVFDYYYAKHLLKHAIYDPINRRRDRIRVAKLKKGANFERLTKLAGNQDAFK